MTPAAVRKKIEALARERDVLLGTSPKRTWRDFGAVSALPQKLPRLVDHRLGRNLDISRRSGRFLNGNTEYRARQQRIAERLAQLTAEYDPTPSQVMLLAVVARHLDDAERARRPALVPSTVRRIVALRQPRQQ